MKRILFSIIVPVYRISEIYLCKCIESIRSQTYTNIEIILIDDGSPDNCGEICDRYSESDNRIRVLHQENKGVSAVRNIGIKEASGEWIWFIDGDDWIEPDSCARLSEYISKTTADIVMFKAWKNYASKQIEINHGITAMRLFDTTSYSDREFLYRKAMQPLNMAKTPVSTSTFYYSCDKVFRKDFLVKNKITYPAGIPISEDKIFVLRCFEKMHQLQYIDELFYHYRINSQSATQRFSITIDEDRRKVISLLRQITENLDTELREMSNRDNGNIIIHDFDLFVVSMIWGILLRKYFNKNYPGSYRQKKAEADILIKSSPFAESLNKIQYKELSWKNIIRLWLVTNSHYRLFVTIERIYNIMKGKIVSG